MNKETPHNPEMEQRKYPKNYQKILEMLFNIAQTYPSNYKENTTFKMLANIFNHLIQFKTLPEDYTSNETLRDWTPQDAEDLLKDFKAALQANTKESKPIELF